MTPTVQHLSHPLHFVSSPPAASPAAQLPSLVLLNICHSEHAANVFTAAGVEHVIACRAGMRVSDQAARYFSRHFFTALFAGQTIQR